MSASASDVTVHVETVVRVIQVVELVILCLAVAVLKRGRTDRRSNASAWALAMFATLAVIVAVSFLNIEDDGSLLRHGFSVVLICVLLLVPYMLVRFTASLGAVGPRSRRVADVLTGAQILLTLFSPRFPQPGEPRSGFFLAFVVLVLVGWTVQSCIAAVGLWLAGRGQPSVVRNRMRALSIGAVVIALVLVAGSGSNPNKYDASQILTSLIGVAGVGLLVLAFVLPGWLRAAWRANDLAELGAAERALMAAVTEEQVADAVLPATAQLFGASGAALLDDDRRPIGNTTLPIEWLQALDLPEPAGASGTVTSLSDGAFVCRLTAGWLVVHAGAFAPVFGAAEVSLLERVGSFVDLALHRCRLFDQEAKSRRAVEAANAELQTLVYSVSHDLRNPIISVLGYLDVLRQEHGGELRGEGARYLERISVNAEYMQNLIQDLLELSRVGRSEPAPQPVALADVADSVAQELRVSHPDCDIRVEGGLPVLWMSELRARQLLTNLMDNAAKHAQGAAVVVVRAEQKANGDAVVTVADNGRGVPEAYRDRAFEVFERLDAARTDIPGTGMGLPICKRIVESLAGVITLEGPADGNVTGTTVRMQFPRAAVRGWTASPHAIDPHAIDPHAIDPHAIDRETV
ncbi:MAG: hypothetical protein QOJ92_1037 [Frankiales bacterium]|jgi:signal transduction histidine kinase|nr:hypothetical protein [Frankiales bacterium]MDX6273827.1 hypothetical protein [Frankiales bacterium]